MSPSKITRGKKKKTLTLPPATHTQNPAKQVEDAWQDSSFNVQPIFLRQFLITSWEFTNLELSKKSNFVFMYLRLFQKI